MSLTLPFDSAIGLVLATILGNEVMGYGNTSMASPLPRQLVKLVIVMVIYQKYSFVCESCAAAVENHAFERSRDQIITDVERIDE